MAVSVAISIGNFDGVHLGHAALVRAARHAAGRGGRVVVLSFDPHPARVLRPATAPARLTTLPQRRALLESAGADEVIALQPTAELLGLAPPEFIERIVAAHRPAVIVEGPDFRFGRGRAGTLDTLRELGVEHGFETRIIEPVEAVLLNQHQVRASSSIVRWLLEHGRVGDAARVLGRPYELAGAVVPGDRRGRAIGVPTANVDHGDGLLPGDGIYAGRARGPDEVWYPAAISIGTKPTFGDHPRLCEVHLIGFTGTLGAYGWTIRVTFDAWLRDQVRFADAGALVVQLRRDIAQAAALEAQPA